MEITLKMLNACLKSHKKSRPTHSVLARNAGFSLLLAGDGCQGVMQM